MGKEEVIYDSTKDKEYYKRYLSNEAKEVLAVTVGSVFIISLGIYLVISSPEDTFEYTMIFFIGFVLLVIPSLSLRLDKRLQQNGLLGLQLNEGGIHFFGTVEYFKQKKKCWRYEDIEFILIDEDINFTVVKTIHTPHVSIDSSLLQKPKKFWLKIHWKDRYNNFKTKMIPDIDAFINALRHCGITVYRRRKGSSIIEAVD